MTRLYNVREIAEGVGAEYHLATFDDGQCLTMRVGAEVFRQTFDWQDLQSLRATVPAMRWLAQWAWLGEDDPRIIMEGTTL